MNPDEDKFKSELEKISILKKCPRCGSLNLFFDKKAGRFYCNECGFEQSFSKI